MGADSTILAQASRLVFMGVPLDLLDQQMVLTRLHACAPGVPFRYVVTPNVDHVVRVNRRPELIGSYRNAWMSWCDSKPVHLIARLFGLKIPHLTGADMTARILAEVVRPGDTLALIAANESLIEGMRRTYPSCTIHGHCPPMDLDSNPTALEACIRFVIDHPARFVFIGVGSPRSELLAERLRLSGRATGTALCIGAALEFAVGQKPRAPALIRKLSLEWLYRMATEPRRLWRRYLLAIVPFLRILTKEVRDTQFYRLKPKHRGTKASPELAAGGRGSDGRR